VDLRPWKFLYNGKGQLKRYALPLMRLQLPECRDICMPAEGIFKQNLYSDFDSKFLPMAGAQGDARAIWG